MSKIYRSLFVVFAALGFSLATDQTASAQYPVAVTTVQPAVVGYVPVRRGLFGRRVVYRPAIAPVVATVPIAPPMVVAPAVAYAAPVTSYYAPAVSTYYAPRVRAYYRPVVPVVRYRVPYGAYYPSFGY